MKYYPSKIVSNFQIDGKLIDVQPYGTGHINDTYASRFRTDCGVIRYIHQRINQNVFKQPEKLMSNIELVTAHLHKKIIEKGGDPRRETLTLVPTVENRMFYIDGEGKYWRTYLFIEGARTYDVVESLDHVYNVAKAFGLFEKMLSDLPGDRLQETIPDFHNTSKRFETFLEAVKKDVKNRSKSVREEINFVLEREKITSVLEDLVAEGKTPERITHNDTKFNNVMIDEKTGEGICVIDLDTVMPGLPMYDFGDSVRIGASTASEDEMDLSKVSLDLEMFDYLAHGYLDAIRGFLIPVEIEHLVFSARLITFTIGLRFLTDHLSGDLYFKIHRESHNLDRCRTQFKMVRDIEEKTDRMKAIIEKYR